MAAYHRIYDSRHLQADWSAPEPYDRQSCMGYLFIYWPFNATSQLENKLPSVEDRRQTDRVTILDNLSPNPDVVWYPHRGELWSLPIHMQTRSSAIAKLYTKIIKIADIDWIIHKNIGKRFSNAAYFTCL